MCSGVSRGGLDSGFRKHKDVSRTEQVRTERVIFFVIQPALSHKLAHVAIETGKLLAQRERCCG